MSKHPEKESPRWHIWLLVISKEQLKDLQIKMYHQNTKMSNDSSWDKQIFSIWLKIDKTMNPLSKCINVFSIHWLNNTSTNSLIVSIVYIQPHTVVLLVLDQMPELHSSVAWEISQMSQRVLRETYCDCCDILPIRSERSLCQCKALTLQ